MLGGFWLTTFFLAHNEDAGKTPAVLGGAAATGPTIDVHRLFLAEAIRKTEDALCDAIRERQPELRVIVGRGSHSKGGKAVLRPALKAEMEKCVSFRFFLQVVLNADA